MTDEIVLIVDAKTDEVLGHVDARTPDLALVESLARVQLSARRRGSRRQSLASARCRAALYLANGCGNAREPAGARLEAIPAWPMLW